MFTFIVVIDNACATDSPITLPVLLFIFITTPNIVTLSCTLSADIVDATHLDDYQIIIF